MDEDYIIDYLTGQKVPDVGAEANRQAVERHLVEEKGYDRQEIHRNTPIHLDMGGQAYDSQVDLTIKLDGRTLMVVKCAPGSLDSREREIVAAARLLEPRPVPLAVVSDGKTAILWDAVTGKEIGNGLDAIPGKADLVQRFKGVEFQPLDMQRLKREKLIFRSYDSMNVNVAG
ncbi:MAG: type I restriction enzyme HsdR N-terminal domain-containing protein [Deltaproteobacteria bacterium]|nr:type I restriction enzyme HsdR N-terminal domain-containing protein [Deltaproteobacteria bacterium]